MIKHLFNRYTFVGAATVLFSMSLNLTSCDLLSKDDDKQPSLNQDSLRQDSIRKDSIRQISIRLDSIRLDSIRQDSIRQDSIKNNQACPGTPSQPYVMLYPNGGESFKVGQTIKIRICTSDPENFPIAGHRSPGIILFDDKGNGGYVKEFTDTSVVEWTIPARLDKFGGSFSTIGKHLRLQVVDYFISDISDLSDADFSIAE